MSNYNRQPSSCSVFATILNNNEVKHKITDVPTFYFPYTAKDGSNYSSALLSSHCTAAIPATPAWDRPQVVQPVPEPGIQVRFLSGNETSVLFQNVSAFSRRKANPTIATKVYAYQSFPLPTPADLQKVSYKEPACRLSFYQIQVTPTYTHLKR